MKLRKNIYILGKDVDVEWKRDTGNYGTWSEAMLKIEMEEGQPLDMAESTMLHEILEALKDLLKLQLSHDDLARLENGLYAVLSDAGVDLSPLVEVKR